MKREKWESYVNYLDIIHRKTNRVQRDNPYEEYFQFPDDRPDFRDEIDNRLMKERLYAVLETLTERERKILTHRFGLEDGVPKSQKQIAEMFCVCGGRIMQLEAKALRKLRHPNRRRQLVDPQDKIEQDQKDAKEAFEQAKKIAEAETQRQRKYDEWWEREGRQKNEERLKIKAENDALAEERRRQALKWVEERDKAIEQRNRSQEAYVNRLVRKVAENRPYRWDAIRKMRIYDE